MAIKSTAPRIIHLETEHYVVRTLEPGDATDSWRDWLTDPTAARNLNAKPERVPAEALQRYIASFDRVSRHLLGVFEKDSGRLIGIRAVYVDAQRREFVVNVIIGESDARNKGARGETRAVMYRYFFEDMDLETARCSVVESNATILKVMNANGWIPEGSSHNPSATGRGQVAVLHFRLPRDVWRQRENARDTAST